MWLGWSRPMHASGRTMLVRLSLMGPVAPGWRVLLQGKPFTILFSMFFLKYVLQGEFYCTPGDRPDPGGERGRGGPPQPVSRGWPGVRPRSCGPVRALYPQCSEGSTQWWSVPPPPFQMGFFICICPKIKYLLYHCSFSL